MPSSVILAMRYDPGREELLIVFRSKRGTYRYFDVPIGEWEEFLEAESKGAYLNRVFKAKEHPYEKTDEAIHLSGKRRGELQLEWGEPEIPRKNAKKAETPEQRAKVTA